ncbi:hypothetical protein HYC85_024029 [Camellia sinensis]|uniref:Uncharacterized protein n=1 Tax=Camellia sinensis TaxID=4442 RepID=A0A7J7GG81_CAMSI|nr:hypothetical protein HYC85_024029 [Camellia sinensis]
MDCPRRHPKSNHIKNVQNKNFFRNFLLEIPPLKGPYSRISTICTWDTCNTDIKRDKNQYQKKKPIWIYPFFPKCSCCSCCKYHNYMYYIFNLLLNHMLDLATSGKGGIETYIGICIISSAFGVADAHVQGGMVGDLSFMLPEFMQLSCFLFFMSFLAGLAASGALTPGLRLITKAAFENSKDGLRKGASIPLHYFLCIGLPKLPIVKYYCSKAALEGSKIVSADLAAGGIHTEPGQEAEEEDSKHHERLSTKELLFQNIDYAFDMFLIYALTMSIFPGFLSEDTGSHSLAMYNIWDLIGRYVPLLKCIKLESRKGLMIAIVSHILLFPAFYFTAKYGGQGWMILLSSFLGLTNGYLTVCVLTSAPKGYKSARVLMQLLRQKQLK